MYDAYTSLVVISLLVQPANFLFVKGVLKLIDFGIAKAIQCDDTTNIYRESQVGTLNYMSPESILDSGTGKNGARMKCGKVRLRCCFQHSASMRQYTCFLTVLFFSLCVV